MAVPVDKAKYRARGLSWMRDGLGRNGATCTAVEAAQVFSSQYALTFALFWQLSCASKRRQPYPTLFGAGVDLVTQRASVVPLLFSMVACWRLCALSPEFNHQLAGLRERRCGKSTALSASIAKSGSNVCSVSFSSRFPLSDKRGSPAICRRFTTSLFAGIPTKSGEEEIIA